MAGCSPEQHKQDADKEVYQIINEKWQDHFPSRANYPAYRAANMDPIESLRHE